MEDLDTSSSKERFMDFFSKVVTSVTLVCNNSVLSSSSSVSLSCCNFSFNGSSWNRQGTKTILTFLFTTDVLEALFALDITLGGSVFNHFTSSFVSKNFFIEVCFSVSLGVFDVSLSGLPLSGDLVIFLIHVFFSSSAIRTQDWQVEN